jgi:hypothetical protein
MPNLLINFEDGNWVAKVANTDIVYVFAGEGEDQIQIVRGFAEFMAEGNPDVADFFINVEDPEVVSEQLFGTTDGIIYNLEPIFTTVGDEFLIDDLEEAGRILIEFIV